MHQLHQPLHGDDARFHKVGVHGGEGRLQSHHAHGALLQAPTLLLGAVGRMVGGDHVDSAVQNALNKGGSVLCTAERGIHLKPCILLQVLVRQNEVVRGGFAGDVDASGLGLTNELHALLGGDVAHMVGAANFLHQLQVTGNLTPLALGADAPMAVCLGVHAVVDVAAKEQVVVLAVCGDDFAQFLGLHHGLAHHFLALHAPPIIGEGGNVLRHGLHVG